MRRSTLLVVVWLAFTGGLAQGSPNEGDFNVQVVISGEQAGVDFGPEPISGVATNGMWTHDLGGKPGGDTVYAAGGMIPNWRRALAEAHAIGSAAFPVCSNWERHGFVNDSYPISARPGHIAIAFRLIYYPKDPS